MDKVKNELKENINLALIDIKNSNDEAKILYKALGKLINRNESTLESMKKISVDVNRLDVVWNDASTETIPVIKTDVEIECDMMETVVKLVKVEIGVQVGETIEDLESKMLISEKTITYDSEIISKKTEEPDHNPQLKCIVNKPKLEIKKTEKSLVDVKSYKPKIETSKLEQVKADKPKIEKSPSDTHKETMRQINSLKSEKEKTDKLKPEHLQTEYSKADMLYYLETFKMQFLNYIRQNPNFSKYLDLFDTVKKESKPKHSKKHKRNRSPKEAKTNVVKESTDDPNLTKCLYDDIDEKFEPTPKKSKKEESNVLLMNKDVPELCQTLKDDMKKAGGVARVEKMCTSISKMNLLKGPVDAKKSKRSVAVQDPAELAKIHEAHYGSDVNVPVKEAPIATDNNGAAPETVYKKRMRERYGLSTVPVELAADVPDKIEPVKLPSVRYDLSESDGGYFLVGNTRNNLEQPMMSQRQQPVSKIGASKHSQKIEDTLVKLQFVPQLQEKVEAARVVKKETKPAPAAEETVEEASKQAKPDLRLILTKKRKLNESSAIPTTKDLEDGEISG